MFTHVLTPVDGSELSMRAARQAIELAKMSSAKLSVLMVSPTFKQLTDEGFVAPVAGAQRQRWKAEVGERAKKVLGIIESEAADAGVKCKAIHVFDDAPYEAIIAAANKAGCDVVVMGSHGRGGMKQFILGSETSRVLSHSKIPVLVYR